MHRVQIDHRDGVVVVSAAGELDAFAAPELSAALSEVAATDHVVVDLGSVAFLDSTALGIVVHGLRELGDRGSETRIVLPHSSARRIFEITTLDRVLPVAASLPLALAELMPAS